MEKKKRRSAEEIFAEQQARHQKRLLAEKRTKLNVMLDAIRSVIAEAAARGDSSLVEVGYLRVHDALKGISERMEEER